MYIYLRRQVLDLLPETTYQKIPPSNCSPLSWKLSKTQTPGKTVVADPRISYSLYEVASSRLEMTVSGNRFDSGNSIDFLRRLNQIQQELHKQRLDSLRNLMQELNEDDWQYPDPEKLLGLK